MGGVVLIIGLFGLLMLVGWIRDNLPAWAQSLAFLLFVGFVFKFLQSTHHNLGIVMVSVWVAFAVGYVLRMEQEDPGGLL